VNHGSLQKYLRQVISGEISGIGAALTRFGLGLLEPVYWLLLILSRGLIRRRTLPRPVYSIGNLTAGGTGKTPTVVWLARLLQEQGRRPAVLSRGYRGKGQSEPVCFTHLTAGISPEQVGDESCMLAKLLPETLICVGRDRYRAGLRALEISPAIDCFILDDGFQHWHLARRLDIVMLDAVNPFGNGHLIPRGLLREPVSALQRADIILLSRAEGAVSNDLAPELAQHTRATIGTIKIAPPRLLTLPEWQENVKGIPAASILTDAKIGILTAIGNPGQFRVAVQRQGASLAFFAEFPDHHSWSQSEIEGVLRQASAIGCEFLVTTAKDAVKLERFAGQLPGLAGLLRILTLEFTVDDKEVLAAIQRKI
jgi:tetraacyldisaccharide 4'-kinase